MQKLRLRKRRAYIHTDAFIIKKMLTHYQIIGSVIPAKLLQTVKNIGKILRLKARKNLYIIFIFIGKLFYALNIARRFVHAHSHSRNKPVFVKLR